ncbi:MAG: cytochrome c [Verrucomicrobia bacterium]|nr:cytochrome c [Verrucomicrobiota bacterium]
MRYFVVGFLLLCVMVFAIAGRRFDHGGGPSRRTPFEIFPDMDRQPKLRPQTRASFFQDGLSSQLPVEGTIARGSAYEDIPFNTGRLPGTTNFVETIPAPMTAALLKRGQERYDIHCAPCHGLAGDGKGVTTKLGMSTIADLHDIKTRKLVQIPDGQLFDTLSNGKGLMQGYAAQVAIPDRWAVVAYVRALQRSRLATLDDVPEALRGQFKK